MELPAVTVLASKNVNAGAAGAWMVLAAEQQGGGMWMRCDWIEGAWCISVGWFNVRTRLYGELRLKVE